MLYCIVYIGSTHLENDEEWLDGVAEDDTLEELPLLQAVPVVVDDLHLLDNGGLARLPGTQQQQLDLPVNLVHQARHTNINTNKYCIVG